jgi:hypothetical protein
LFQKISTFIQKNYKTNLIMKKSILLFSAVAALVMASCGGAKEEEKKDGPELCTCVNEKWENDEEKTACEEMRKEWEAKYNDSSEDDKKKMMEEIEACVKAK